MTILDILWFLVPLLPADLSGERKTARFCPFPPTQTPANTAQNQTCAQKIDPATLTLKEHLSEKLTPVHLPVHPSTPHNRSDGTCIKQHNTAHSLLASDTVERLTSPTKPTSAFLMSSNPRAVSCSAFHPHPPAISINCLKRCWFLVVMLISESDRTLIMTD
ncbi:hypothetical protein ILYODFUR_029829 [Ilyodon furcidens]|uniref:Secreted protein n=1 Tax=Ilyodon furcidens TaxID=33524 RepID=A0ABV0SQA1_9TELE